MCKRILLYLALALIVSAAFGKTALDLMLEGRYGEAKAILDTSNVSPRYQLLYFAMVESDAARACSLYQVVAIRYPHTDCDTVARVRLDQAQEIGFVLMPIAEWSQAPQEVRPLTLRRKQTISTGISIPSQTVVESTPPVPAVVPPLPVSETTEVPPAEESAMRDTVPITSMRDTIVPPKDAAVIVETGDADTGETDTVLPAVHQAETPPQAAVVYEEPAASLPAAKETSSPEGIIEASPPPDTSLAQKAEPEIEQLKTETRETLSPVPMIADTTEPAATVTDTAIHERPASNGHWYIQVGAFANYDNAHKLALRLQNAGFPVKLVPRDTAKGKLLQVRVGGYATREEIPPLVERLKTDFQVPTVVVSD